MDLLCEKREHLTAAQGHLQQAGRVALAALEARSAAQQASSRPEALMRHGRELESQADDAALQAKAARHCQEQ